MNDYRKTAEYYDALLGSRYSYVDLDFYLKFITDDTRVLDVGCGTGRVSLTIATNRKNCTIDALDISPHMLRIFREKMETVLLKKNSTIKLYRMDMRKITLNRRYDFVIFPFQSFQCITDSDEQVLILRKAKSLLGENGRIILSVFDPTYRFLANKPVTYFQEIDYNHDNSLIIKLIKDARIDMRKKLYFFTEHLMIFNIYRILVEEISDSFRVAYHDYGNLVRLFGRSGLSIESQYSNYKLKKLADDEVSFDKIFVLK
jgi:SAM-dependent methyltransferase